MPRYPIEIGCVDFRSMRERQLRYVDKTAFIAEFLVSNRPTVSLITRPRRFGKTLTMSMLKEFFDIRRKGTRSFDGLAIKYNHTLCDEWMNKFPILSLSLKDVGTGDFSRALEGMRFIISELCDEHAYLADSPQLTEQNKKDFQALTARQGDLAFLSSSLRLLCRLLVKHWGSAPILLIDDYDDPLTRARQYGYQEPMAGFLRDFFSRALKDNTDLALAVLTGCLQTPGQRLFSDLNTVRCYGISDTKFADKFGFTSAEVDALLEQAGIPDKAPLLREWYGGYLFGARSELYCPWNVLQYLAEYADNPSHTPQCYRMNTSENFLHKQFFEETNLPISEKLRALAKGEPVIATIEGGASCGEQSSPMHLWSILHQTGYLTRCPDAWLAETGRTLRPGQAALVLPNRELYTWLATSVDNFFTETLQQTDQAFFEAFWLSGEEAVSRRLAQLCSRTEGYQEYYAHFHHTLVLRLFQAFQYDAAFSFERGPAESYLIVLHHNRKDAAVMAIRTGREDVLENLTRLAIEQIRVYLEQYDVPCCKPGARIFCWGVAFAQKECVARCRLVEC